MMCYVWSCFCQERISDCHCEALSCASPSQSQVILLCIADARCLTSQLIMLKVHCQKIVMSFWFHLHLCASNCCQWPVKREIKFGEFMLNPSLLPPPTKVNCSYTKMNCWICYLKKSWICKLSLCLRLKPLTLSIRSHNSYRFFDLVRDWLYHHVLTAFTEFLWYGAPVCLNWYRTVSLNYFNIPIYTCGTWMVSHCYKKIGVWEWKLGNIETVYHLNLPSNFPGSFLP